MRAVLLVIRDELSRCRSARAVGELTTRIRQGYDLIVFASTETARNFPGFVEGAIRAGREVAAQLVAGKAGRKSPA